MLMIPGVNSAPKKAVLGYFVSSSSGYMPGGLLLFKSGFQKLLSLYKRMTMEYVLSLTRRNDDDNELEEVTEAVVPQEYFSVHNMFVALESLLLAEGYSPDDLAAYHSQIVSMYIHN